MRNLGDTRSHKRGPKTYKYTIDSSSWIQMMW